MANTMIATKSVNYNNSESAKQNLLNNVKVQVKKLMEEAVIRSYVHEDSETITKFCSSVETVLLNGIRRSIFTWMEEETTFILCQKIAKFCPEAQQTLDRMEFHKQAILKRRNDHQSKGNNSPLCIKTKSSNSLLSPSPSSSSSSSSSEKSSPSMHFTFWANENKNNFHQSNNTTLVNGRRDTAFQNFWIRVALLEKVLDKIVYFLTIHSSQYYEHCSIIADPCDGQLITDLLRGPCTIDYSRTRTSDHLFTDPPVSELIQRHGIYGGLMSRQLSYVPPVSQQLTTDEQTPEDDDDDEDNDNIPTDTTEINSNNTSPMDLLKQSQKLLNTDKVNHNDTNLNDNSKRKTKYISIPAITMNPLEEEKEDDKIGLGYEEDDDGISHLPIDSIINNNRKRYSNRKNDLNAGNLNALNQSGWMTKRASSPLLNVNDLPTSRGIRTGSCALLPQINEYNSTKSNRNPKSTKNIALAAKDHVESMHQSLKTILLYGKNNV
ncbi:unnamed protein product [Heterobilharzia americana]|nr:unnamed protein product [Heterobilharzia americana]